MKEININKLSQNRVCHLNFITKIRENFPKSRQNNTFNISNPNKI